MHERIYYTHRFIHQRIYYTHRLWSYSIFTHPLYLLRWMPRSCSTARPYNKTYILPDSHFSWGCMCWIIRKTPWPIPTPLYRTVSYYMLQETAIRDSTWTLTVPSSGEAAQGIYNTSWRHCASAHCLALTQRRGQIHGSLKTAKM